MYKEKFEKELQQILCKFFLVVMKIGEIEGNSGLSESEIEELNKRFLGESHKHLYKQYETLKKDLCEMLVDAKFQILGEPESKISGLIKGVEKVLSEEIRKHLEEAMWLESNLSINDRMKRLGDIEILCLTDVHPSPKIHRLYEQIIRCYFHGLFDACCILCRIIVEKIAKTRISHSKYKNLLKDGIKSSDKVPIAVILEKQGLLPDSLREELASLYKRVISKADKLLHDKEEIATQKDALNSIKHLKLFIEKFPPVKIL